MDNLPMKFIAIFTAIVLTIIFIAVIVFKISDRKPDPPQPVTTQAEDTSKPHSDVSLTYPGSVSTTARTTTLPFSTVPSFSTVPTKPTVHTNPTKPTNPTNPTNPTVSTTRAVVLKSISITSLPNKTSYYTGSEFSKQGLEVKAVYSNNTTRDVTSLVGCPAPNMSTAGSKKVTVSYTENGVRCEAYFSITVVAPSITVSPSQREMTVGSTYSLTASPKPSTAFVNWSTSNSSVATVSSTGTVTAVSPGSAVITAKINYGNKSYSSSCSVTVKANPGNSELDVYFEARYDDNGDNTITITDFLGYVESNYNITKVRIGVEGPDSTQYYDITSSSFGTTKSIELEDYKNYTFDVVPGETYTLFVEATDASGNTKRDSGTFTV